VQKLSVFGRCSVVTETAEQHTGVLLKFLIREDYLPHLEIPKRNGGASELSPVGLDNQVTYFFLFIILCFFFFFLLKKRRSAYAIFDRSIANKERVGD